MYMWHTDAHVTVSSGTRAYEASVQVYQRVVVYDYPSSRLTAFGRLKPNNKCKLQSQAQIKAGEDNCSIMAMCVWIDVCILYNREREREIDVEWGYQMPGADVTNRLHNSRTSEVLQILIYLLDKIPLFQYEGQVRLIKVCDVTANHK